MSITLTISCIAIAVFIILFVVSWYTSRTCPKCNGELVEGVHYYRCMNCGRTYRKD